MSNHNQGGAWGSVGGLFFDFRKRVLTQRRKLGTANTAVINPAITVPNVVIIAAQIVASAPELSDGDGVGVGAIATGSGRTCTGNLGNPNVYGKLCFPLLVDVH